jgi:hypothetical protein
MEVEKKEIDLRTTPHKHAMTAWIVSGLIVLVLAVAGWLLLKPAPTKNASGGTGVIATAPAGPPQPLNADDAPRSD